MHNRPMTPILRSLLVLCSLLLAAAASAACGAGSVCKDVVQTLSGQIEIEAVTTDWTTDSEDSTVEEYVLKRYDCAEPSTCSVTVATIAARGTCGVDEDYSYTDEPPGPITSWTYTLEVWKVGNRRACSVDVEPE